MGGNEPSSVLSFSLCFEIICVSPQNSSILTNGSAAICFPMCPLFSDLFESSHIGFSSVDILDIL